MKVWFDVALPRGNMTLQQWCFALFSNFLGTSASAYKKLIIAFLVINTSLWPVLPATALAWIFLIEFIVVLALSLYCHPLLPGGLLAIQIVLFGLTDTQSIYVEVQNGLSVIFLVIFMVAGIHFLRDMLFLLFSRAIVWLGSPLRLIVGVSSATAVLSAFLDALTIMAILLTIAGGFHETFRNAANNSGSAISTEKINAFLCGFLMHGAVATAYGGVTTLIGEPENLIIGNQVGWNFQQFFIEVAPVSVPTFFAGILTCIALEKLRWFNYGAQLPEDARVILVAQADEIGATMTNARWMKITAQIVIAILMILGLMFHVAEIGLLGLAVLVLGASMNGVNDEHRLSRAFLEGMPFASLLVVFFVVVAMIHSQHLFAPFIQRILELDGLTQLQLMFITNGLLSAISDNVFVATIFIAESKQAWQAQLLSDEQFVQHAVAITMGTGIPSMATPNGQAAFLFLLTAPLARKIGLGYSKMVWMALPYLLVTTLTSWISLHWLM